MIYAGQASQCVDGALVALQVHVDDGAVAGVELAGLRSQFEQSLAAGLQLRPVAGRGVEPALAVFEAEFLQPCAAQAAGLFEQLRVLVFLPGGGGKRVGLVGRGERFGFLFQTSDESEVTRLIDLLRAAFQTVALRDPRTGRNLGHLTLSAGVCMSESADSALDLAAACERALADAKGGGGDQVVVYGRGDAVPAGKEWMLYRA